MQPRRSDDQIEREVTLEMNWAPSLRTLPIKVVVKRGVVTLSGTVSSVEQLREAERVVLNVPGVSRIAKSVELRPDTGAERRDDDLRRRAIISLRRHLRQPARAITVRVTNCHINVAGEVEDQFQRDAAECALASLFGAAGVTNELTVRPSADEKDIRQRITTALRRRAEREAENIKVTISGTTVILKGAVGTPGERLLIEGAALSARGVSQIELHIEVTCDLPPGWKPPLGVHTSASSPQQPQGMEQDPTPARSNPRPRTR